MTSLYQGISSSTMETVYETEISCAAPDHAVGSKSMDHITVVAKLSGLRMEAKRYAIDGGHEKVIYFSCKCKATFQ